MKNSTWRKPLTSCPPRVAVYCGAGSSHSFVWLASLFERAGWYHVKYVDEQAIKKESGLSALDLVVFSGGAPRGMAEALGPDGAEALKRFVLQGGVYTGLCAGACLPLHSSRYPLSLFNWLHLPIANLDEHPPEPIALPWKYRTPYGDRFVFHPVREEVIINVVGQKRDDEARMIAAPLYGGPCLINGNDGRVQTVARFTGFTGKTLFLTDPAVAERVVLNRAASVSAAMGRGRLLLFSPHLEHPFYPPANRFFLQKLADSITREKNFSPDNAAKEFIDWQPGPLLTELRASISNARIRAMGLIPRPLYWTIGQKVYEPEKAWVLLNAVFSRLPLMQKTRQWPEDAEARLEMMIQRARACDTLLRTIAELEERRSDTTAAAEQTFTSLRQLTAQFLNLTVELNEQNQARITREKQNVNSVSVPEAR